MPSTQYTPAPAIGRTEKDAANGVAALNSNAKLSPSVIPNGGALPAVTSSDNGKFLTVSNGAWAVTSIPAAEGSGF